MNKDREDSQSPPTGQVTGSSLGQCAPEHLGAQEAIATSYKYYLDLLKSGGTSGISIQFRSAADILCGIPDFSPPPRLDFRFLRPCGNAEITARARYLIEIISNSLWEFLEGFLANCRDGKYGSDAVKVINTDNVIDKEKASLKDLVCTSLYLIALEQYDSTDPRIAWLRDFLWEALSCTDDLIKWPPFQDILQTYDSAEVYKVCRTAASNVCSHLHLGKMGEESWSAINDYLLESGKLRSKLLKLALTDKVN